MPKMRGLKIPGRKANNTTAPDGATRDAPNGGNLNSGATTGKQKITVISIFLGAVASIGGFMFGYESGEISGTCRTLTTIILVANTNAYQVSLPTRTSWIDSVRMESSAPSAKVPSSACFPREHFSDASSRLLSLTASVARRPFRSRLSGILSESSSRSLLPATGFSSPWVDSRLVLESERSQPACLCTSLSQLPKQFVVPSLLHTNWPSQWGFGPPTW